MGTKRYKRDFKALETRRRRGMRMLARGVSQAEVARQCEVSRQPAMTWVRMRAEDPQAWRRRALGRPGVLDARQRSCSSGQAAGARRHGQRLSDRAVDAGAGGQADRARVRLRLQHLVRVAAAARDGLFRAAPGRPCHPARRAGDPQLEGQALTGAKNARRNGRTIVFVDESGLSERPTRVKTWAPKGGPRCCSTASTGSSSR